MIVWCQKCETEPIELDVDSGVYWLGDPEDRPTCPLCFYADYPQRFLLAAQLAADYVWALVGLPDPAPQLFGIDWSSWFGDTEDHIIRSEN